MCHFLCIYLYWCFCFVSTKGTGLYCHDLGIQMRKGREDSGFKVLIKTVGLVILIAVGTTYETD